MWGSGAPGTSARSSTGRLAQSPRPAELQAVRDTLVTAGQLTDMLRGGASMTHACTGRSFAPRAARRLEASIDPSLEILDSASPLLGGLRRQVRISYERLRSRLETLIHGELGAALQEPLITLRHGRYVVPVRSEARSRVRGIVHDQSGSGQTLFVEPLIAVELGNAWREAQLAVQAEVERILDELSGLVASQAVPLRQTVGSARVRPPGRRARLAERWMPYGRRPAGRRSPAVCPTPGLLTGR
jgi:dsDNA-specific endonuclease/ATPase MutS2